MFITFGDRNDAGIEFSFVKDYSYDSYIDERICFDVAVCLFYLVHLIAFRVTRKHMAFCIFNMQFIVYFR